MDFGKIFMCGPRRKTIEWQLQRNNRFRFKVRVAGRHQVSCELLGEGGKEGIVKMREQAQMDTLESWMAATRYRKVVQ